MMRAPVDVICKRYPSQGGQPFGFYSDHELCGQLPGTSFIGVCVFECDIAELAESVGRVYLLQSLGQDGRVVGSPARP